MSLLLTPAFAVLAFRGAIRIGKTSLDAFEQYANERPILLPDAELLELDLTAEITEAELAYPEFRERLAQGRLAALWKEGTATDAEDLKILVGVANQFKHRHAGQYSDLNGDIQSERLNGLMVAQWAKGKGNVSPFVRVVIAMVDVGLEFVGANPQLLGIGGQGEKLVGAIAVAVAGTIPDDPDATLGPREHFAERLAANALRAGLSVLSEKPDLVFDEEHLQVLLKSSLPPVLEALPASIPEAVKWRDVLDSLLGPALGAAISTVAEHQTAFLGKDFATDKAAGVVAAGILKAAAGLPDDERFTREGFVSLLVAAIGAAAEHPALVLGDVLNSDFDDAADLSLPEAAAFNLFTSVFNELKNRRPPYNRGVGLAVAAAAIDGLKLTAPVLISGDSTWETAALSITTQVLDGFKAGLGEGADFKKTVFSAKALAELARMIVSEAAKTPQLLAGDRKELQAVVTAVASAIAADGDMLLSADDWLNIAKVALEEASQNPGRLFGIDTTTPAGKAGADILKQLMSVAAAEFGDRKSKNPGPLLTGKTLRQLVIVTLRGVAAKDGEAVSGIAAAVGDLVSQLVTKAVEGDKYGSKELLRLYQKLLPKVLADGAKVAVSQAEIENILRA